MKTRVRTTVGELIALLFDQTQRLSWLKNREKQLLVAFMLNDMVRGSVFLGNGGVALKKVK
jgi:hypothetical protein